MLKLFELLKSNKLIIADSCCEDNTFCIIHNWLNDYVKEKLNILRAIF